ncbi:MAG: tyrosine-type recombinase/integrase [Chitinophagaceae bacterium]
MKIDIHNFKHRLELVELAIRSGEIPGKDQRNIWEFRDQCFANGLSLARVSKYMQCIKRLYFLSSCAILEASPRDIVSLLALIERSPWQPWTKHDYKLSLRKYLAFSCRKDLSDLIKLPKSTTHKLPEELLTPDDICVLMGFATDAMTRALIITLYESGCRIGELLGIRRKHVQMDAIGAVLIVDGKTGMRRVRVIEAAPYLDEWISEGSFSPDDPIFPISYFTFRKRLRALQVNAGIGKRIYPHLFRHSRATFLASYLTEAQLCMHHGWTIGSHMPRIYVHLNSKDLDSTLMNVPGILPATRLNGAILGA